MKRLTTGIRTRDHLSSILVNDWADDHRVFCNLWLFWIGRRIWQRLLSSSWTLGRIKISNWNIQIEIWNVASSKCHLFLLLAQSAHLYLRTCVLPHTPIDGVAKIFLFPNSYATAGNWTQNSSVAPLLRDLNSGRFTYWTTAAASNSDLTYGENGWGHIQISLNWLFIEWHAEWKAKLTCYLFTSDITVDCCVTRRYILSHIPNLMSHLQTLNWTQY